MKTLLRIAFLSLALGLSLAFTATVQAQVTAMDTVDELPVPPKGMKGFTRYLLENLKYPITAREAGTQGMVVLSFVVTAEGKIDAVEVLRGIGNGCDEEAVRVITRSGTWSPGIKDGKAVATRMKFPVNFKL
jgi:TonB family protein